MLQSVHVEQRMAAFPLNKINFCLLHRALPDVQSETWRMLWAANRRGISRADLTNPLPFLLSYEYKFLYNWYHKKNYDCVYALKSLSTYKKRNINQTYYYYFSRS